MGLRQLHILPISLLWWSLHKNIQLLHLKLHMRSIHLRGTLHLQWHMRSIHLWGTEELVMLRKAGPNIASGGLPRKWWLLLAILLHFLDFVLNHNGFVNHVLELSVIHVVQLELNIIIQPIQEHVLLLLIRVDFIWGVLGQLNE
jgi:hypothetical protein